MQAFNTTKALAVPALAVSLFALAASVGAATAQDTYNWSGIYAGASAGVVETRNSTDISYGAGPYGWNGNNVFTGEIYDDVDGASVTTYYETGGLPGSSTAALDLSTEDWTEWLTQQDLSILDWSATAFAGVQQQFGALVVGGEFRATVGDFDTNTTEAWRNYATDSDSSGCGIGVCDGLSADLPDSGLWDGYVGGIPSGGGAGISGDVDQYNTLDFAVGFDQSFAAVARAGIALDRFMFYGTAGATVARVTASTSATVNEIGHINVGTGASEPLAAIVGEVDYAWSGSTTEDRIGYVAGLGVEYALTDNIILRGEATYTDYGTVSVTGVSDDPTVDSYTVDQKLTQLQVQTGVMLKF